MNDCEYTFRQDIRDKKSLAASAKHKKNGAKSTKVSFPSDNLTKKQWESKNGEIKTMYLNRPMTYRDFKSMPLDLQERYLACLVDAYGVSNTHLANMMGVSPKTLYSYIRNHKFTKVRLRKGHPYLTKKQEQDWEEFLSRRDIYVEERGVVEGPEKTNDISEKVLIEEDAMNEPISKNTEDPENPNDVTDNPADDIGDVSEALNISDVHLRFEGNLDISVIMSFLQFSIGEKVHGELQISFIKTENIEEGEKCESDAI